MNNPNESTRMTLLGRLRQDPSNQETWGEFVENYGPKIYGWCRYWKLQESDAQDVTQDVLLRLANKMREFEYDPSKSFRAWLKTLTHHAWVDFVRKSGRTERGSGDTAFGQMLDTVEARDDLLQRLNDEFDRELMDEAMTRVRLRVAPNTWKAFELTALKQQAGADVGKELDMPVAHVYVAKNRVQKMIKEMVASLENSSSNDETLP